MIKGDKCHDKHKKQEFDFVRTIVKEASNSIFSSLYFKDPLKRTSQTSSVERDIIWNNNKGMCRVICVPITLTCKRAMV